MSIFKKTSDVKYPVDASSLLYLPQKAALAEKKSHEVWMMMMIVAGLMWVGLVICCLLPNNSSDIKREAASGPHGLFPQILGSCSLVRVHSYPRTVVGK